MAGYSNITTQKACFTHASRLFVQPLSRTLTGSRHKSNASEEKYSTRANANNVIKNTCLQ